MPSPTTARGATSTRGQVNTGGQTTTKNSSPRGKTKGSAAKSRGLLRNSPPGEKRGETAKSAAVTVSLGREKGVKDSAERVTPLAHSRTSAVESMLSGSESGGGEGEGEGGRGRQEESLLTANRTTYFKVREREGGRGEIIYERMEKKLKQKLCMFPL